MGSSPDLLSKQKAPRRVLFVLVRIVGLEPTRKKHRNLNPTRLPIPPHPHLALFYHGYPPLSMETAQAFPLVENRLR